MNKKDTLYLWGWGLFIAVVAMVFLAANPTTTKEMTYIEKFELAELARKLERGR